MVKYDRMPLEVVLDINTDGYFIPKRIIFDEICYDIEKVLSTRKYSPPVACFCPTEYTVVINGSVKKIYFEHIEEKRGVGRFLWFSVREYQY